MLGKTAMANHLPEYFFHIHACSMSFQALAVFPKKPQIKRDYFKNQVVLLEKLT